MRIIVCLDDRNGMSFCGRRHSTDRILRARAVELAGEEPLWMNPYSAGQFQDLPNRVRVAEDFTKDRKPEDWCFVESLRDLPSWENIHMLVIFRWNRHYPSDMKFPMEALNAWGTLIHREDFPGYSHECITQEVYQP